MDKARASGVLDQAFRCLGVAALGEVAEGDVGALAGIGQRHRAANAAVRAGNQRDLALELARAAIGLFAVVRTRVHPVGLARHRLLLCRKRGLGVVLHRRSPCVPHF